MSNVPSPPSSDTEEVKAMTRREFLRHVGKTLPGAALIVWLARHSSLGAAESISNAIPNYDPSEHLFAYVVDVKKCIGCGSCVRACSIENNVPEHFVRTWVERYVVDEQDEVMVDSPDGGINGFKPLTIGVHPSKAYFVPKICNHCANTPCSQVCPVGASYTNQDGVVLVDSKRCIGCGYCVQACPFGSRYINPTTKTAEKCTWCYHRITKGMKPACVQACPTGARMFGDLMNEKDPIRKIVTEEHLAVLQPDKLTRPRCYYLNADKEIR